MNNDLHGTVTWAVNKTPTSNVPTVPAPETEIAVTVLKLLVEVATPALAIVRSSV